MFSLITIGLVNIVAAIIVCGMSLVDAKAVKLPKLSFRRSSNVSHGQAVMLRSIVSYSEVRND